MTTIRPCEIPKTALLLNYQSEETFSDCYVTEIECTVSQPAFIEAFYTTPLFKIERTLIGWLLGRPSSDLDAKQLAEGKTDTFAAWRVENRHPDQLLLADVTGRTKSWLMIEAIGSTNKETRLYFGSAVLPQRNAQTGKQKMGFAFHALQGFHRLYSKLLLSAARARILDRHTS